MQDQGIYQLEATELPLITSIHIAGIIQYDTLSMLLLLRVYAQPAVLPSACVCCNFRIGL